MFLLYFSTYVENYSPSVVVAVAGRVSVVLTASVLLVYVDTRRTHCAMAAASPAGPSSAASPATAAAAAAAAAVSDN